MNIKAFERINYGLFLLSGVTEGKPVGCVVNSLHQVTPRNPYTFSVTVNKSNETFKAIQAGGTFAATVLSKDCPKELVDLFGYKSSRVVNKFEGLDVGRDEAGNPYVKEHALARFSFQVVDQLDLGSYVLFIARATEAEVLGQGQTLTLEEFKGIGKPTPPTATVYRTVEITGWRCTVCGYIAELEELPEDFRCPLCRAPRDKFEKL